MRKAKTTLVASLVIGVAGACLATTAMPSSAFAASQAIGDGVYQLTNVYNQKNMTHSSYQQANAQVVPVVRDDVQAQFYFKYNTVRQAYQIQSMASMGYLADNSIGENTSYLGNTYDATADESFWELTVDSKNQYTIVNKKTRWLMYMDTAAPTEYADGTFYRVKTGSNTNTTRQMWQLLKVEDRPRALISNGNYIVSADDRADMSLLLDVKNGSMGNNASVQIYPYTKTDAQRWRIRFDMYTGTYQIANVKSGKVLDVANGQYVENTPLQQYTANNSGAQQWYIIKTAEGKYNLRTISGNDVKYPATDESKFGSHQLVIGAPGVSPFVGTGINFTFIPTSEEPSDPASSFANNTPVIITSTLNPINYREKDVVKKNVLCMDIFDGSKYDRANVRLYKNNDTAAQWFIMKKLNNGYYQFTNVRSSKVLDVKNGSKKNGANLWQYSANGTYAQQFKVQWNADGSYTLISRVAGTVVDLNANKQALGTNIHMWKSNGTSAQKWWIQSPSHIL